MVKTSNDIDITINFTLDSRYRVESSFRIIAQEPSRNVNLDVKYDNIVDYSLLGKIFLSDPEDIGFRKKMCIISQFKGVIFS